EAGQLQLNVFEPIIAYRLLGGMNCLARACRILQDRCVEGITANRERMHMFVEQSVGVITALVPRLGYEMTNEIAKEALETGRGVYDLVCERGLMTREELDRLLNPATMVAPHPDQ
ncbi:MAG: aspartate ammonia-lyase, partial [Gemmatimonadota bacterium]|nr:aspartate ammonia-lyase [Gemmatimonadota bacterium]